MKSLTKLATVVLPLVLLTACANTNKMSEMAALQASVESATASAEAALSAAQGAQRVKER